MLRGSNDISRLEYTILLVTIFHSANYSLILTIQTPSFLILKLEYLCRFGIYRSLYFILALVTISQFHTRKVYWENAHLVENDFGELSNQKIYEAIVRNCTFVLRITLRKLSYQVRSGCIIAVFNTSNIPKFL